MKNYLLFLICGLLAVSVISCGTNNSENNESESFSNESVESINPDLVKVQEFNDAVRAIGEVTLDSKELIEYAEKLFNNLTPEQKQMTNYANSLSFKRIEYDSMVEHQCVPGTINGKPMLLPDFALDNGHKGSWSNGTEEIFRYNIWASSTDNARWWYSEYKEYVSERTQVHENPDATQNYKGGEFTFMNDQGTTITVVWSHYTNSDTLQVKAPLK